MLHLALISAVGVLIGTTGTDDPEAPPPPRAERADAPTGSGTTTPAQPTYDAPPPSAWDKQQADEQPLEQIPGEDYNLLGQVAQTLFALLFIIGLIYLLAKVVVPRLMNLKLPRRVGRLLQVVEQVPLDARHAIYLVRVGEHETVLLGTGDKGVQLLTRVDLPNAPATADQSKIQAPSRPFKLAMDKAGDRTANEATEVDGNG